MSFQSLAKACLFIAVCSYANTLLIPYTSGKQSGTFKIKGDYPQQFVLMDTIVIDTSILITNLHGAKSFSSCCFVPTGEFAVLLKNQNGVYGKSVASDTVWANAKSFRDTLLPLDSIPLPTYSYIKDSGNNPKGINVELDYKGGEATFGYFELIHGYNSVVYFKFNRGGGDRYGKLQLYGYDLDTGGTVGGGRPIAAWKMAYTISNTKDLDSGPITVSLNPFQSEKGNNFLFLPRYFDLNGRSRRNPARFSPPIPLFPARR